MNRVLAYLPSPRCCPACAKLHEVERQLEAAKAVAERIEELLGDTGEFWIPSVARIIHPADDHDDEVGIRLILSLESELSPLDADLAAFTIAELRRIGGEILAAADRVQGGVA